jgi:hypothetical protein
MRGEGGRDCREDTRIDDRHRVPSPHRSSPRMDHRMPSPRRMVSTPSPPPYTSLPRARAPRQTSEHAWNARVGKDEGHRRVVSQDPSDDFGKHHEEE